jgi:hypothetical protein
MRLIYIESSVMLVTELAESHEVRAIPVHAVVALHHHPAGGRISSAFQSSLELIQIEMGENGRFCFGQPDAVDERSVVQLVGEHGVALGKKSGKGPDICRVARGKE